MVSLFERLTRLVSALSNAFSPRRPDGSGERDGPKRKECLRESKRILETQLLPRVQGGTLSAEDKVAFCRVMLLLHEAGAFDGLRQS